MPMGAALLCGPIYLLMVAKVQKRWSVTILGIIMGIIWFATGMHWAFSLGYIGMGLIADLVAGAGHYRNKAINLLSYMLISLGGIYTYVAVSYTQLDVYKRQAQHRAGVSCLRI